MTYPLVAPLAALMAGIAVAQYATFSFRETLISITLLSGLAVLARRAGSLRTGVPACLAGFAFAGALLASLPDLPNPLLISSVTEHEHDPEQEVANFDDPIRLRGYVRIPTEPLDLADQFVLEVESIFADTVAQGGVRVTVRRREGDPPLTLEYGQRIEFLCRLRRPRNFGNPGSFDRVGYLEKQDIYLLATVRSGTPIHDLGDGGGEAWEAAMWNVRRAAKRRLDALLSGRPGKPLEAPDETYSGASREASSEAFSEGKAILKAMLLGDRSLLDRETTTAFQRVGTYHALVISGLHVGVVAAVLLFALRLAAVPPLLRYFVALFAVIFYALLVGAGLPVVRASWMFVLLLVTVLVYRKRRAFNAVAGAALCFLLYEPDLLFDAGFQMSFLAVGLIAGIAVPLLDVTVEPYRQALVDIWNEDRDLHVKPEVAQRRVSLRMLLKPLQSITRLPKRVLGALVCGPLRVLAWMAALCVVSLVVQIGLALPMAAHFHRVTWSGVSANLWVVPLLFIAVPAGLLGLVANSTAMLDVALLASQMIVTVVEWHAEHIPVDFRTPAPPVWLAAAFGLALGLLAIALGRRKAPRGQLASAGLVVGLLMLIVSHPFPPDYLPGQLELTAIDVGQGEALLMALPDGKIVMVDGGGFPDYGGSVRSTFDVGEHVVSPYLWSRSIQKIDVLAVSHLDADHAGGVPALLRNFSVGELWLAADQLSADYADLKRLARQHGAAVVELRRDDRRLVGGVEFDVMGPAVAVHSPGARSLSSNDRSLVLRARFGEHRFLLTGDVEERGELELLSTSAATKVDVLKVAHHGSRTSSHPAFLERLRPTFGLISAGFRNTYRHPHEEVLNRLKGSGATILRTDLEGASTVSSDGRRLYVTSFRSRRLGL